MADNSVPGPFFIGNRSSNRTSHHRWVICSFLFLATVIAYIDRGVLSYLETFLQSVIPGLNSISYGYITSAFLAAYAIGLVCAGGITDKLGTRKAFAIAITLWSVAAMLPGLATSVVTFGIAMFLLGIGEAANFPSCIKTVAEWFPKRERALATGIFNSGANIGNMLVPAVVPFLVFEFGWRGAFFSTGALGLVWLAAWLVFYERPEKHRSVSEQELQLILSDPIEPIERVPWRTVVGCKETWAFAIGKFLTDPIWWFYLFWLPQYLHSTFGLNISQNRAPLMAVYAISLVGSIGGGWISSFLIKRGKSANFARKTAMLISAVLVIPVFFAPQMHHLWGVVALVGLATAAHQGWSANIFTLPSDMFPKAAVGSVVGIGGMMGSIGGALFQASAGHIIAYTHSYVPLFIIACSAYSVALLIIQCITPKLAPAKLD